jgi:hypothetical protein
MRRRRTHAKVIADVELDLLEYSRVEGYMSYEEEEDTCHMRRRRIHACLSTAG